MIKYRLSLIINIVIGWLVANAVFAFSKAMLTQPPLVLKFVFFLIYIVFFIIHTSGYFKISKIIGHALDEVEAVLPSAYTIFDSTKNVFPKTIFFNENRIKTRLDYLVAAINQSYSQIRELEKVNETKTKTLDTLLAVSQQALITENIGDYYELILSASLNVIEKATKGTILVRNPVTDQFVYETAIGYPLDVLKEITFDFNQTFASLAVDHNPIIVNIASHNHNSLSEEQYDSLQRANGLDIAESLCATIMIDDEIYAEINIDSIETGAFTESDIELMKFFTAQISIALKNILKLEETIALSKVDKLTGLYNRNYFDKRMAARMNVSLETIQQYAIILCDLDNLKIINDTYGHRAGDEVLKMFARMIESELTPNDLFARIGGDEFIIVIKNQSPESVKLFMQSLYERKQHTTVYFNTQDLPVRFSYGIAFSPEDSMIYDILTKLADARMYEFKHKRKEIIS